ncbi:MAG TPA: dihydrolipoamide acyltransferase [Prevotellaceae bacterium]|nr:dihydrolipoamide acyltransferase [Prevotellaceae bacterium]
MMNIGLTHTSALEVTDDKTAARMGSGDLDVLATPAMLALMENAAMLAVAAELPVGSTTVGGYISSSHLVPTPLGATVTATATLTAVEGRKLTFRVEAHDADGRLLGEGSHLRFVVDRERFLSRL